MTRVSLTSATPVPCEVDRSGDGSARLVPGTGGGWSVTPSLCHPVRPRA